MTYDEIVKDLEICSTYKAKCIDCPAYVKVDLSNCKKVLFGALDLINRQKAEIERLKDFEKNVYEAVEELRNKIKAEAVKEFEERLLDEYDPDDYTPDLIRRVSKEMVGEPRKGD